MSCTISRICYTDLAVLYVTWHYVGFVHNNVPVYEVLIASTMLGEDCQPSP